MKNDYKILGDTTIIYLKRRDGSFLEALVSTNDLPKLKATDYSWHAKWNENNKSFYVVASKIIDGVKKTIPLHRFLTDAQPDQIPDHINHQPLDNRRENLRLISVGGNNQNLKGAKKNSKSGIRCVSWHKVTQKWRVQIGVKGKTKHIGFYHDIKEAEKAAIEARAKYLPYSTN